MRKEKKKKNNNTVKRQGMNKWTVWQAGEMMDEGRMEPG